MTFVVSLSQMQRLDAAELARVGRFVAETGTIDGDEPFPPAFLAALRRLVPCDSVTFCELDRDRPARARSLVLPRGTARRRRLVPRLLGGARRAPGLPLPRGDRRLARLPPLRLRRAPSPALEQDLCRVVPPPRGREPDHGGSRRAALAHEGVPPRSERRSRLRRLGLPRARRAASVSRDAVRGGAVAPPAQDESRCSDLTPKRAGGPRARRRRQDERADRGAALDLRRHGAPPPREHLRKARRPHAHRRGSSVAARVSGPARRSVLHGARPRRLSAARPREI